MAMVFENKSSQVGVEYTETSFGILCWAGKADDWHCYYPCETVKSFRYAYEDNGEKRKIVVLTLHNGNLVYLPNGKLICISTNKFMDSEYGSEA